MKWEKYNIISSKEKLEALDKFLMTDGAPNFEIMAVDSETNGLYFFKNVIIGVSFSVSRDVGFYIPLLTWISTGESKSRKINKVSTDVTSEGHFQDLWSDRTYPENVSPKEYQVPKLIKDYVVKWLKAYPLIMHNAPFDCSMFYSNFGHNPVDNLFCDTGLLKHFLDENTKSGLKETAEQWKTPLGFNPSESAASEQKELGTSIVKNGGKYNARTKHIWRGDYDIVGKYACKDTMLTYGIYEVGMQRFGEKYSDYHHTLFFEDEIMPLCKEVVIPMYIHGVYIDVPYFQSLEKEAAKLLTSFEDLIMQKITPHLENFVKGKTMAKVVTTKSLVEAIIEKESLAYPTAMSKGVLKKSLAKGAIKKAHAEDPHWLWDYVLGEGELKYSDEELKALKQEVYEKKTGNRYQFNLSSKDHLRWLLFDKLGNDKTKVKQTDSATPKNPIPSVDEEVLSLFEKKYDFIGPLLVYNKLSKLHSTYILPALALNNNGWLHLNLKQNGTTSGRFSCSGGFNLQTLPKVEEIASCPKCDSKKVVPTLKGSLLMDLRCNDCKFFEKDMVCYSAIKAGFVAPKGQKIVNADFTSLEPKAFAFMSGDEKLKAVYKQNLDLYSKVYCDMLDPEHQYSADPNSANYLKKKAPEKRSMFKPVVLGIPYGARAPQVARLLGLKKEIDVKERTKSGKEYWVKKEILDVEQGKKYRDLYLETYDKLKEYMETCELEAISRGYVETLFGRRRRFKYVQPIAQLIGQYGISKEDFIDMKYKDLEKENTSHGLDYEGLLWFSETLDIPMWKIKEKGNWAYIRGLFSNELNNAKNMPIQGLAAHITNRAMLEVVRAFKAKKINATVVLQVHDEVSVYAEENNAEAAAATLKDRMEHNKFAMRLDIPMQAVPVICNSLKDSK